MPDFKKLAFEAKDILEYVKENPEVVGVPVGAAAGVGLMRTLTDKNDRDAADYAVSGTGGAGAGYLLSKALSPGKLKKPEESFLERTGVPSVTRTAWDNKGILGAVAALAIAARFRASWIPPLRAELKPIRDLILGADIPKAP